MPYQPDEYLAAHFNSDGLDLTSRIDAQLREIAPESPNLALYRDMMLTVLRMAEDDSSRWNAKITLQALRELTHAFRVLERYRGKRKVTVFGSARTPLEHPLYAQATELGSALADAGMMVITGGGGGIMAAAHKGAGREHSLGFNITLPFEQHANATIEGTEQLLPFHFFFIRKLFFLKEADALVLCPGGFGTLDEAMEVLTLIQTGKSPLVPVVLLDTPDGTFWKGALDFIREQLEANRYILPSDMKLLRLVHSPEAAVAEIDQFYSNFHSTRWLQKLFVIRMHHPLTEAALTFIRKEFAALCLSDTFVQQADEGAQSNEPEFAHLSRLGFNFNGRDQGRLRELVDYINQPENWVPAAATPKVISAAKLRQPS